MTERHMLLAFLATLGAIVLLFAMACVCLYNGKSVEAIGIGGVMTGLIGVLGTFRPNPRAPNVGPNENVNVTTDTSTGEMGT